MHCASKYLVMWILHLFQWWKRNIILKDHIGGQLMHALNEYSFQKWTQAQMLSRNGHMILLQILQFLKLCTLGKLTQFPWCWGVTQWPCVYPRGLAKLYHSWLHHYSLKVNHNQKYFHTFPISKVQYFFSRWSGHSDPPVDFYWTSDGKHLHGMEHSLLQCIKYRCYWDPVKHES